MTTSDVLGNVDDPAWSERLVGMKIDVLRLDQWEAQKNRLRKLTEAGAEVALSLDRHVHLHDGDIVAFDGQTAIVARLDLGEVMVVDLSAVPAAELIHTAIEVGHAIGNQHWPAVIKNDHVYVPLTVDRKVTAAVMKTHGFEGVTYDFISGAEVLPFMAPHESRRLFGEASRTA